MRRSKFCFMRNFSRCYHAKCKTRILHSYLPRTIALYIIIYCTCARAYIRLAGLIYHANAVRMRFIKHSYHHRTKSLPAQLLFFYKYLDTIEKFTKIRRKKEIRRIH